MRSSALVLDFHDNATPRVVHSLPYLLSAGEYVCGQKTRQASTLQRVLITATVKKDLGLRYLSPNTFVENL